MKTPIKLFLDNKEVAIISTFGYETPWASGKTQFIDNDFFEKLVNVTEMLSFDSELEDLNLSEEEIVWNNKLVELNITSNDLKLEAGKWSIKPHGESMRDIYAVRFYKEGFIDWRL